MLEYETSFSSESSKYPQQIHVDATSGSRLCVRSVELGTNHFTLNDRTQFRIRELIGNIPPSEYGSELQIMMCVAVQSALRA